MKHAWLLDIIGDLRRYSQKNGLPKLAEELATCESLAAIEMSTSEVDAEESKIVRPRFQSH